MILVTGASGLIGASLIDKLSAEGRQVRAIYRAAAGNQPGIEWVQGDILDIASLQKAMQGVTHVFHCAGLVSFAPRDKQLLYKVNVEGTANVVNVCLATPGVKLCHVSSVAAIGKIQGETHPTEKSRWEAQQGHSVYAASKHWGEAEVWRGIAEGLNAVIVNPSVVLGGTDTSRSSTKLLGYINAGNRFYVDGQSNFVDLRDVTEAMLRLMFSGISGERFILNGGSVVYNRFFALAARCLGKRPPKIKLPLPLAQLFAKAEQVRSWLTGARPLVTPDTVRRGHDVLEYNASKVTKAVGVSFRPVEETITWACQQIKNSGSQTQKIKTK